MAAYLHGGDKYMRNSHFESRLSASLARMTVTETEDDGMVGDERERLREYEEDMEDMEEDYVSRRDPPSSLFTGQTSTTELVKQSSSALIHAIEDAPKDIVQKGHEGWDCAMGFAAEQGLIPAF